jgi:hypothetical protein
MSLAGLIRKSENRSVATAIFAIPATTGAKTGETVARIAGIAVASPEKQKTASLRGDVLAWRWRIHFADREPRVVSFSPEAARAEVLKQYPDAVAAEPFSPDVQPVAPLHPDEEAVIRAWLASICEDGPDTVEGVISNCRQSIGARGYFLGRSRDAS